MAGASGMADEVSESFLSLESDPDLNQVLQRDPKSAQL